jgi:hypothetical protein
MGCTSTNQRRLRRFGQLFIGIRLPIENLGHWLSGSL